MIIDVVRGEGVAAGKKIPPYIALGSDAYAYELDALNTAKSILDEWKDVTFSTDFE